VYRNASLIKLSGRFQHRTADFAFIFDGIFGILEQQMASINNMLPGSRRSVPYIVDTSECYYLSFRVKTILQRPSRSVLENHRTEQGMAYTSEQSDNELSETSEIQGVPLGTREVEGFLGISSMLFSRYQGQTW
jgi:hypothetical protein